MKRPRVGGVLSVIVAILGLSVALYIMYTISLYVRSKFTFVPTQGQPFPEPKVAFQNHFIETSDKERLHSWYLPASAPTDKLVIYFHGNGGNLGDYTQTLTE